MEKKSLEWLKTFENEVRLEREEAKEEMFKRFGQELETSQQDKDSVFLCMDQDMIKSFSQTIQHLQKMNKSMQQTRYTFCFTEKGIFRDNFGQNDKMGSTLFLSRNFFQEYVIDTGLEITLTLELERCSLLHSKRKDTFDTLYVIASNAGMACWAVTRNPKKHCPDFYPTMERHIRELDPPRSLQAAVEFGFLSDEFVQAQCVVSSEKAALSQSANLSHTMYMQYTNSPSQFSLSTSAKALQESRCTPIYYPKIISYGKSLEEKKESAKWIWNGTFPKDTISSFCKLSNSNSPIVFVTLVLEPTPVLRLRTYYSELSLPDSECSYFEISMEDQDSFVKRQEKLLEQQSSMVTAAL